MVGTSCRSSVRRASSVKKKKGTTKKCVCVCVRFVVVAGGDGSGGVGVGVGVVLLLVVVVVFWVWGWGGGGALVRETLSNNGVIEQGTTKHLDTKIPNLSINQSNTGACAGCVHALTHAYAHTRCICTYQ